MKKTRYQYPFSILQREPFNVGVSIPLVPVYSTSVVIYTISCLLQVTVNPPSLMSFKCWTCKMFKPTITNARVLLLHSQENPRQLGVRPRFMNIDGMSYPLAMCHDNNRDEFFCGGWSMQSAASTIITHKEVVVILIIIIIITLQGARTLLSTTHKLLHQILHYQSFFNMKMRNTVMNGKKFKSLA